MSLKKTSQHSQSNFRWQTGEGELEIEIYFIYKKKSNTKQDILLMHDRIIHKRVL